MIRHSEKCATLSYRTARIYDKSITMKDESCVYVNLNVFSYSNCCQYLLYYVKEKNMLQCDKRSLGLGFIINPLGCISP